MALAAAAVAVAATTSNSADAGAETEKDKEAPESPMAVDAPPLTDDVTPGDSVSVSAGNSGGGATMTKRDLIDYAKHREAIDAFKDEMIYRRMRAEEAEHRMCVWHFSISFFRCCTTLFFRLAG